MKDKLFKDGRLIPQFATYLKLVSLESSIVLSKVQMNFVCAMLVGILAVRYEYVARLALVEVATIVCLVYSVMLAAALMLTKRFSFLWNIIRVFVMLRLFILGVELTGYGILEHYEIPIAITALISSTVSSFLPDYLKARYRKLLFDKVLDGNYLLQKEHVSTEEIVPNSFYDFYEDRVALDTFINTIETNSTKDDYSNYVSLSYVRLNDEFKSHKSLHRNVSDVSRMQVITAAFAFHPFGKSSSFKQELVRLRIHESDAIVQEVGEVQVIES